MLGFLVMGLLGLFFLPAYWRRAVRLSTRSVEARMPLSMEEIVAERDALRAGAARDIRLIEIKSEQARAGQARDRIDLGRRAVEVAGLASEIAAAKGEIASLQHQFEAARLARADADAQRFAAVKEIWDANGLLQRSRAAHADLLREHRDLESHADGQRATIAALDTRVSSLEMRLEDRRRALAQADVRHEALSGAAAALQATLDAAAADGEQSRQAMARLQGRHDKAQARIAQMEAALAGAAAAHAAGSAVLEREIAARAAARDALAAAVAREGELQAALQRQSEVAQAANANLAKRIEGLREEIAALKRKDAAAAPAPDMAMLRQAIADLGAEMLRLNRAPVDGEDDARPAAQKLRALQTAALSN